MNFISNFLERNAFGCVCLLLIGMYFPYVQYDTMISGDDKLLVSPMEQVSSLAEYISAMNSNLILDVQPLRDLSFLLNVKLREWTRFSSFHLFNLLMILIAVYLSRTLFLALHFRKSIANWGMVLFAVHPVLVSAVGWVSARKHSVALIFIFLALIDFFRNQKITWKAAMYVFISSLSHQIFIFFPVWVFFYSWIRKWKIHWWPLIGMAVGIGSVSLLATVKTFYINTGQVEYLQQSHLENMSRFVLSLGRSAAIILFPYSISAHYWQGSYWNLVGLFLMGAAALWFYRTPVKRELFSWLFLAILSFVPTFIAFVNNTYLYLTLICWIVCVCTILSGLQPKKAMAIFSVAALLLLAKTISVSQMWRNTQSMWATSWENEPSPYNAIGVSALVEDSDQALSLLRWGAANYPVDKNSNVFGYFFLRIEGAAIPRTEKIKIFEEGYQDSPAYKARLAMFLLEGDSSEMERGTDILKRMIQKGEKTTDFDKLIEDICQHKEKACAILKETIKEQQYER